MRHTAVQLSNATERLRCEHALCSLSARQMSVKSMASGTMDGTVERSGYLRLG
jgi:hypothetical protein